MREHLKLQQELFFSFLVDRLIRPAGSLTSAGARKGEMESELDAHTWNVAESPVSGHSSVTLAGTPMKSVHSLGGTERRSSGSLTQSGGPSSGGSRQQQAVFTHANEARELMLEYLAQYARAPDFMTNLWINYDCNVDCEDLFERLIKFLSRVCSLKRSCHIPVPLLRVTSCFSLISIRASTRLCQITPIIRTIRSCNVSILFSLSSTTSLRV
jgi:brefeldin A-resistance guanine nucleotide exchange factor 1